jgi:hypothetical protein
VGVFSSARASLIATGFNHVCAIVSGRVECWGWNAGGQFGRQTSNLYDPTPRPVQF